MRCESNLMLMETSLMQRRRVIPVHGVETPLKELIQAEDYDYPDWNARDFSTGGPMCA